MHKAFPKQEISEGAMEIIKPVSLTTNDVAFTNATTNTTYTQWSAGTYTPGTLRYVGMTVYQVATNQTNSTSNTPPAAPWVVYGNIDPYKCFDGKVGTLTISSGTNSTMSIATTTSQLVNSAAFLSLDAGSLTLTVTDSVEGLVYSHSQDLIADIDNWYQYFFYPYDQITDVILDDLPTYPSATVKLTLSRASGSVSVGEVVFGQIRSIGDTQFGANAGITDFSRKTTDDEGNYTIEERPFIKRADFDVQMDITTFDSVYRFLSSIRASPCVYIGDKTKSSLIVYGFARRFDQVLSNPVLTTCSLSVEGL